MTLCCPFLQLGEGGSGRDQWLRGRMFRAGGAEDRYACDGFSVIREVPDTEGCIAEVYYGQSRAW